MVAADDADAALIAAAAAYPLVQQEYERSGTITDDDSCPIWRRLTALEDFVQDTPATTPRGVKAKADVLVARWGDISFPDDGADMVRSLFKDIRRQASLAA
jgi:hypothetical protein